MLLRAVLTAGSVAWLTISVPRKSREAIKASTHHKEKKSLTYNDLEILLQLLTQVEIQNISKYNLCEIKERGSLFWKRNKKKIEQLNTLSLESSETTRQT